MGLLLYLKIAMQRRERGPKGKEEPKSRKTAKSPTFIFHAPPRH